MACTEEYDEDVASSADDIRANRPKRQKPETSNGGGKGWAPSTPSTPPPPPPPSVSTCRTDEDCGDTESSFCDYAENAGYTSGMHGVCRPKTFAGDCDADDPLGKQGIERCNAKNDILVDDGLDGRALCADGGRPSGWVVNVSSIGHAPYLLADGSPSLGLGGPALDAYVIRAMNHYGVGTPGYGYCAAATNVARAGICLSGYPSSQRCSVSCDRVTKNGRTVGSCIAYGTPLIVNFDGKGIALSSRAEGVRFDVFATGASVRTGWTTKPSSDMFLVHDVDHDGVIRDGRELFGDRTRGPDGQTADNGFLALAKYDANHDGVIDAKDPVFHELGLWSDKDGDGKSSPGEILSLRSMGVSAIRLAYTTSDEKDAEGNQLRQVSSIELANGETRKIVDVWFATTRD